MESNLCIILITTHKETLSTQEEASLKQCYSILKKHPIRLICPLGINVSNYLKIIPEAQFEFIDSKWTSNIYMFNRLLILPLLYKKFNRYQYILFYELDAWVFRDDLEYWCNKDYDYIGAPWFEGWGTPSPNAKFIGIGNGGFSLRKVNSHLKALNSFSYVIKPKELIKIFQANKSIRGFFNLVKNLTISNNTYKWFNDCFMNHDIFWGMIVADNFKWFKLPSIEEALSFSVETKPSKFITAPDKLPFGCHAWAKYEPEFWKNYIKT